MHNSHLPQTNDSMLGKLLVASTLMDDPVLSRSVCLVVHQDTENVFAVLLNRPMAPPPELAAMLSAQSPSDNATPSSELSNIDGEASQYKSSISSEGSETNSPSEGHGQAKPRFKLPATNNSSPRPTAGDNTLSNPQASAAQVAAEASKTLGAIHFGGPLSGPVVAVHGSKEHAEAVAGQGVYVAAQKNLLEGLVKNRPEAMRLIVGHLGWSIDQLHAEREAGYWHVIDARSEDVFAGDQELWPSVVRRATTDSVSRWIGTPGAHRSALLN